jgi:hypothetical protein
MDENAQIQMPDGGPPVNLRTTNIRGKLINKSKKVVTTSC